MDKTRELRLVSPMSGPRNPDLLRALLRGPCVVTNVDRRVFPAGHATPDQIIVSHRLILVTAGRLDYTIEGARKGLRAGNWIWVPAWSRRRWTAARGGCELSWCEFSTDPVTVPAGFHLVESAGAEARVRLAAMAKHWKTRDAWAALVLEAELKHLAAEFWTHAEGERVAVAKERHPEVRRAIAWLETHYAGADALDLFYRELTLSPSHFRLLFRRETGETVQAMLARLRLRRARYLVTETALSLKEIAAECGIDDPLYFSQHYRRFWGRPPSADRGAGQVA
jgi:AraC-like DNA-binding protein